jgi:hypothetical protein
MFLVKPPATAGGSDLLHIAQTIDSIRNRSSIFDPVRKPGKSAKYVISRKIRKIPQTPQNGISIDF